MNQKQEWGNGLSTTPGRNPWNGSEHTKINTKRNQGPATKWWKYREPLVRSVMSRFTNERDKETAQLTIQTTATHKKMYNSFPFLFDLLPRNEWHPNISKVEKKCFSDMVGDRNLLPDFQRNSFQSWGKMCQNCRVFCISTLHRGRVGLAPKVVTLRRGHVRFLENFRSFRQILSRRFALNGRRVALEILRDAGCYFVSCSTRWWGCSAGLSPEDEHEDERHCILSWQRSP